MFNPQSSRYGGWVVAWGSGLEGGREEGWVGYREESIRGRIEETQRKYFVPQLWYILYHN